MLAKFRKARAMYYKGGGRDDRGALAPEPKNGYDLPVPVEEFPNDEAADAAAAAARAQDVKIANTLNQSGGNDRTIPKDEVEVHQFSNATPQGNNAMKRLQEIKLQQDFNKSTDVANHTLPDKHQMGGFRKRKRWPPQKKKTRKRKKRKKKKRKTKRGGSIEFVPKKTKHTNHGYLQRHNIYNPINPIMKKIGGKKKTKKYKKRKRRRTRKKK